MLRTTGVLSGPRTPPGSGRRYRRADPGHNLCSPCRRKPTASIRRHGMGGHATLSTGPDSLFGYGQPSWALTRLLGQRGGNVCDAVAGTENRWKLLPRMYAMTI